MAVRSALAHSFEPGRVRTRALVFAFAALMLVAGAIAAPPVAGTTYKQPPKEVVDIVDAPAPPVVVMSPNGESMLLADVETLLPIEVLARPFLKLAGERVDPARSALRRELRMKGIAVQSLKDSDAVARPIALPEGARIGMPVWSFDSRRFAFTRETPDGVELWVADAKSGETRALPGVHVNDILGTPFDWTRDHKHLLVRTVPASRGPAPAANTVPEGPRVSETAGKKTRMATYQDLLTDTHDEALFEYYAKSQLAMVDVETGNTTPLGPPDLYADTDWSPNGEYLFVLRHARPFSFRVPYDNFARVAEVWSRDGKVAATVASLPVADEVPQQGVPMGPRGIGWQPLQPATLVWVEALDGGDPRAKVAHRDKVRRVRVADAVKRAGKDGVVDLAAAAEDMLSMKERVRGFWWLGRRDHVWIGEYDRDRRWTTTWSADFGHSQRALRKVFDRSINDSYADPGNPVLQTRSDGSRVARQDGDFIYLAGRGATPEGDRPFLDRMDLRSLQKTRLFRSAADADEQFVGFVSSTEIVATRQAPTEPPNQYLVDLVGGRRTQVTDYRDPAPQLAGIQKRLIEYKRADGAPLTAFLYLPPGYQPGTKLPVFLWAYPREYSDAGTAGQVRGSENTFVRLGGISHLFLLTQGYAILDSPTMAVIGDPETMNDTYVEQVVGCAQAAVDTLVAMGVADPERIGIGGHSYGAFMTANLLAHSDMFAAGIARSGAYNRSLTPFGFQAERRSYWEATEIYTRISPFTYANKIDEPILLIHGEEDNNSGTFPIQSERLFQALQGNGATARLVMLPFEGHGYRARESVLHTLAEMIEWADKYVKNRPARGGEQSRR